MIEMVCLYMCIVCTQVYIIVCMFFTVFLSFFLLVAGLLTMGKQTSKLAKTNLDNLAETTHCKSSAFSFSYFLSFFFLYSSLVSSSVYLCLF